MLEWNMFGCFRDVCWKRFNCSLFQVTTKLLHIILFASDGDRRCDDFLQGNLYKGSKPAFKPWKTRI